MNLVGVDPEKFTAETKNGRGAWTRQGIGFDYRYRIPADKSLPRIGTVCELSQAHWAVAAGVYAIQLRLMQLGHMGTVMPDERGIFGPRTERGVRAFQGKSVDPQTGDKLTVDGIVGRSDARALFTPVIRSAEKGYGIPDGLILGQTMHESVMDPGCIGYFIYYPEYKGVDRGMSQINSKANPQVSWLQAFDAEYAFDWSARRLSEYFERYRKANPKQKVDVLWDAAVCAHNNPSAGLKWARSGVAPTDQAAKYVASVKAAIF